MTTTNVATTVTTTVQDEVKELWSMDSAALRARYCAVFNREPRVRHPAWLRRRIAWELQARVYGGLSATARKRINELIAEIQLPVDTAATVTGAVTSKRNRSGLTPGTTITKHWRGRDLLLRVLDDGFEVGGNRYPTLSAAANGITGTHWNGALFWGVKTRRKSS